VEEHKDTTFKICCQKHQNLSWWSVQLLKEVMVQGGAGGSGGARVVMVGLV
jgi:hypothetical protein